MEGKFKLIEMSYSQTRGYVLTEFDRYDSYMDVAKTGNLKFGFGKPKYFKSDCYDNYSIQVLGKYAFMIFTKDYDETKAFNMFMNTFISTLQRKLDNIPLEKIELESKIELYKSLIKPIQNEQH